MNAKDLRIGNIVDTINRANEIHLPANCPMQVGQIELFKVHLYGFEVDPVAKVQYIEMDVNDLSPIALNKEWMEIFDFKNDFDSDDYWYHPKMRTFSTSRGRVYLPYKCYDSSAPCGYVHELQNLFFALTGNELKYKTTQALADNNCTNTIKEDLD